MLAETAVLEVLEVKVNKVTKSGKILDKMIVTGLLLVHHNLAGQLLADIKLVVSEVTDILELIIMFNAITGTTITVELVEPEVLLVEPVELVELVA